MIKKENTNTRTGMEIAVIGMSAKFPGVRNIHQYWDNLENGVESISFFSEEELEDAGIDTGLFNASNYIKSCGHLQGKELFDASFFGYSPMEAELMDPQIRVFHECIWEALEDAGYNPDYYTDKIGLYAGASNSFYWQAISHLSGKSHELGRFAASHLIDQDYLCSRVSYNLNLKGASSFVHTACSTSLVAIHQACRALLTSESEMILAGGIAISPAGGQGYLYQEGMILSRDGHCRAFAGNASGTIRGEGTGVVLLKRLKPALQARDHIYAIIRGTAINNDGKRKVGFTAPSVEAQAEVIRTARRMARVEPETITYIEAHGTGTNLGDVVEIEALKLAFNTGKKNYCAIGSVKSNFGHLDAAAGVAGFIKTVLALKHKRIPPTLHYETPNSAIDFKNSPFFINTILKNWQGNGNPLRAGVSSFGIGGTNAHVVLEEMPNHREEKEDKNPRLILLSARTPTALEQMTINLAGYFNTYPRANLEDVSYTLQVGRKDFRHRRMVICSRNQEAIDTLLNPDSPRSGTFSLPDEKEKSVIYMFPGQGSQYINMGLELYQKEPVFREQMDRCFEILKPVMNYNIKEILYPPAACDMHPQPGINQTEIAQPLLFALEYALSRLIMKWGIKPAAMIGHSVGEYTAACLSGVFSLEDALEMVVLRGRLMQQMPPGSMLSVPLDEEALAPFLNKELSVAAVNTSAGCVVSGPVSGISKLAEQLKEKGYEVRFLHTSHAFHSSLMDPVLEKFEEKIKQIKLNSPQIPYISNVTGGWAAAEVTEPAYWAKQLRSPVLFRDGLSVLLKRENSVFVEIGPGKALSTFVRQHRDRKPTQLAVNLMRHPGEKAADDFYLLKKIGHLWMYGLTIDWNKFYENRKEKPYRSSLPTYPFERQRYWLEERPLEEAPWGLTEKSQLKKKKNPAGWLYSPIWSRSLLPLFNNKDHQEWESSIFLVFIDDFGLGIQLIQQLKEKRHTVISAKAGLLFTRLNDNQYVINPHNPGDYIALFSELRDIGIIPDTIIHLWNITALNSKKSTLERIKNIKYQVFFSLIFQVQAIERLKLNHTINLMVVSNHLQEVTGQEELCPEKAILLGPVKVIPQEFPNIKCRSIDTLFLTPDEEQDKELIDHLLLEFFHESQETIVAYRGKHRWIQTYESVPVKKSDEKPLRFRDKGVYLVTGGLGNIGLTLAEYLARTVHARLVLTGRSDFPVRSQWDEFLDKNKNNSIARKIRKLQDIEKLGAELLVKSADAANEEQMQKVIQEAEETFGPINGIIHSAGIVGRQSIQAINEITPLDWEKHASPKIYGLLVLEKLFKNKELDFCYLMSSLSSVLGGLGFASYAATSLFMDSYAMRHNKDTSPHWTSINWDGWYFSDKDGLMGTPGTSTTGTPHYALTSTEGVETFEHILAWSKIPQIIVSTVDLGTRLNQWVKFESLGEENDEKHPELTTFQFQGRPHLSNPYVEPQSQLEQQVVNIWEKFLGVQPVGMLDDFFELGGDSLKAVTLLGKIHKILNIAVPISEFFNKSTVKELIEYFSGAEVSTHFSIRPAEKKEYYGLSSAQRRLYVLQQIDLEGVGYNEYHMGILEGRLDRERFTSAIQTLIQRHDILRSSLFIVKGQPVQKVHNEVEFALEYNDPENRQKAKGNEELLPESILKKFVRPIDLSHPPFLRVRLIKKGERQHILFLDMHHIITDGVSFGIFIKELGALYGGQDLPPLTLQYKDYSEWQNTQNQQAIIISQEEYWLNRFQDEVPVLNLTTDYPRPVGRSFEGNSMNFEVGDPDTERLKKMGLEGDATLFMVLIAISSIFLARLSGQEDIVIGSPIAGRTHTDLQYIMGIFINTLAIRNKPDGQKTFQTFLKEVKKTTLEAFENQDYPFENLVDKVDVSRDLSRNSLFDVMFVLQNAELEPGMIEEVRITDLKWKFLGHESKNAKFDLTFKAVERAGQLHVTLNYCTRLFEKETIRQFISYFKKIISEILNNNDILLSEIDIIPGNEKKQLLYDFNDTEAEYRTNKTIHELFAGQSLQTPDNIAIVAGCFPISYNHDCFNEKIASFTYNYLNDRANRLAALLRKKGILTDSIISILANPSFEMMVAVIAVLKTGGCYVPVAPGTPEGRIAFILKDSESQLLLAQQHRAHFPEFDGEILNIDDETLYNSTSLIPAKTSASTNPVYMIYTSGTTGTPKGVQVKHENLVNYVNWFTLEAHIICQDKTLLTSSFAFDLGYTSIYPSLLTGAQLHILSKETYMLPGSLLDYIRIHGTTYLKMTPSLFGAVVEDVSFTRKTCKTLRLIVLGGEAINVKDVEKAYSICGHLRIINHYGPTEATIGCIAQYIDPAHIKAYKSRPTIGKPIRNTKVFILDKYMNPLPPGIGGELCLSGAGVAKGYFKREDLTREKFIPNNILSGNKVSPPYDRIYRTGDRARWLSNGVIEFLGRMDQQVKIRGYRIELSEIENQLQAYEAVAEAAVLALTAASGNQYLCAYVVFANDSDVHAVSPAAIKEYLSFSLPDYMVPGHFVTLDKLPLTPNGKLDRKSLPQPELGLSGDYVAPHDHIEKKIAAIWSQVLDLEEPQLGINANFFELGGHSLKAITIIANIHKAFNVKVPLIEMFRTPSVRGIAAYIKKAEKDRYESIGPVEKKEYFALSSAQKRIYILQQMELESTAYNMSVTISLAKEPDLKLFEEIFLQLIERHESLRTSFLIVDNHPVQKVHEELEFAVDLFVLKDNIETGNRLPHSTGLAYSKREILRHFDSAFDLSLAPLLKVGIVKADQDQYLLVVVMHHIISDALSNEILVNDFMTIHGGRELLPLRIQYKDFSQWQNSEKEKENIKRQGLYWLKEFAGEVPVLNMPNDYTRPAIQSFDGDSLSFDIGRVDYQSLKKYAREEGVTLFMLLLALIHIWLSKLSSQEDIVVGTPVAGRRHTDLEKIMGMFVNTLALRNYPKGEKTFREFLREVKQRTVDAFENQEYQFEDLVDKVGILRDAGRNPLFDVMFILGNIEGDNRGKGKNQDVDKPGKEKLLNQQHQEENVKETTKFDLTLFTSESGEKLAFTFGYCTRLFKKETIERFILYFKKVLSSVGNDTDLKLWQIDSLPEEQKKQVLYDFNNTTRKYPLNKALHHLLEEQTRRSPDNAAVIFHDRQLTNKELNHKSSRLAEALKEKGVRVDTSVGIMMERSIAMIIAILGILKAGGAYLPIEPGYPADRIDFMLNDSSARALITTNSLTADVKKLRSFDDKEKFEIIFIDSFDFAAFSSSLLPAYPPSHSPNLAYVIYTSGSTGKPKGVMIKHVSAVNILFSLFDAYRFEKKDTYLFKTPYVFDVSVTELFGWILGGGRLAILDNDAEKDPQKLSDTIANLEVTHINFVPSMFKVFTDWLSPQTIEQLSSLKYIFLAGESLLFSQVHKFRELEPEGKIRLENIYGPTEAAIYAAHYSLSHQESRESIPIGKPLSNIKLYILSPYDVCQPLGIPGELCISGICLARGYLNRPELTGEKFCLRRSGALFIKTAPVRESSAKNFLLDHQPSNTRYLVIYYTGDLCRWLPDGNIEFLGRMDQQVKIRGNRVELGEIENYLLTHSKVKEAVVLQRDDSDGTNYLCAYIALTNKSTMEQFSSLQAELRNHLSQSLPDYMIPSYFVYVDNIPLTPSNKVDRKILPLPKIESHTIYSAPRNKIEEKLVEIWIDVLNIEGALSIDDNFFHLGGHSLKAVIMSSRTHKSLDVKIPLAEVFKTPTIRGLSRYIREAEKDNYLAIESVEKKEFYALSSAQTRLYILQQMEVENTAYNMPQVISLAGEPHIKKFEESFLKLIQRHDSLRTSFYMLKDEPVQKVHDWVEFKIEYYEITVSGNDQEDPQYLPQSAYSNQDIIKHFSSAFDLSRAPLLKAGILKTKEEKYVLVVVMHHIISDGFSHEILVKDFVTIHGGHELFPLRIQYKDFSQWQNSEKEKENIKRQGLYWLKEFAGEVPVLNMPTDYTRPAIQSFDGDSLSFDIGRVDYQSLKKYAREEGVTLFMLLLALIHIWLSKLSSQEDIVVGTPVAGRRHAELENIMGMFVNTLALRNYPAGEKNFSKFLAEVKARTLTALENQDYQFEELVEKVMPHRDAGRNPLFDVIFLLNNINIGASSLTGKKQVLPEEEESAYEIENRIVKFDLTLFAVEADEKILFSFQYCTRLFKKETIQRYATYFKKIISTISQDPFRKIADIDILTPEEKQQLIFDFNDRTVEYPRDKTLHGLFEEQVERIPDNIAVVGVQELQEGELLKGAGEGGGLPVINSITYSELNEKANQLACYLREHGGKENQLIGLMVERTPGMIVGILGILKAGCGYVPLNPKAPRIRNLYILDECSVRLLVTTRIFSESLDAGKEIVHLEEFGELHTVSHHLPGDLKTVWDLGFPQKPSTLAYVIFTSGSTGNPKGVPISHSNLSPLLHWGYKNLGIGSTDRTLQVLSYYFDWSVWEVFITLTRGASLYMVLDDTLLNPGESIGFMNKHRITVLHATPTQYRYIANVGEQLVTVKYLFLGAEKLSHDLLARSLGTIKEDCRVFNMYGPTECTIIASAFEIDRSGQSHKNYTHLSGVPIGVPVGNTSLLVLDKYCCLCPVNIVGELYIGGDGTAPGYLCDPEKTHKAFIKNIYETGGINGPRLYKTGDLVRWQTDGNIEYLGRIDHQVKIRGYRIELGEIESQLLKYPGLREVVVLTREIEKGDKYICAYIVPHDSRDAGGIPGLSSKLKQHLSQFLPDYMIPSSFMLIDKIPLNPNGKIDRKALPVPVIKKADVSMAPRDETEKKLVKIWSEVLGSDGDLGIDDNFFQLGGHSLKAVSMLAKVHQQLDIKIPLKEIFKIPSIKGISQYIKDMKGSTEDRYLAIRSVEKKEYYGLSSAQKRLYILQQMGLENTAYNIPQVIPLTEKPEEEIFEKIFPRLIKKYESLRTSFYMVGDEPVQEVHDAVEFDVQYYKVEDSAVRNTINNFVRPFDLSRTPLLRIGVLTTDRGENLLLVDMHHIISDGVSREILMAAFTALYIGGTLPPLRIQYKDFSHWQNQEKQQEAIKQQEAFWLNSFAGEIPVLNLPIDQPRPAVQSFAGNTLTFGIPTECIRGLKTVALEANATLYMVLLSVFYILLSRLSTQEDIVVGTAVAGRRHADIEKIIGMFVNTLALRHKPLGEKPIHQFLLEIKEQTLKAFENQEYPFEDLVEKTAVNRDIGRNPLFDVMFNFRKFDDNDKKKSFKAHTPGYAKKEEGNVYENIYNNSKFDLTLTIGGQNGNMVPVFTYNTALFKKETIQRFTHYFKNILSAVTTADKEMKLFQIEIMSGLEKKQVLYDFNCTEMDIEEGNANTIDRIFNQQSARTPDKIAVSTPDQGMVTYRWLNEKSLLLARWMWNKGVGHGDLVAIMVEPTVEMISGIMAVLKTSSGYVPIDPGNPRERMNYILEDSEAKLLLTQTHLLDKTGGYASEVLPIDTGNGNLLSIDSAEPGTSKQTGDSGPGDENNHPVYMIYTSGTTGKPKGVVIIHRNLVNYVEWFSRQADLTGDDRTILTSSFAFDLGYTSIYPTLLAGGQLHILLKERYILPRSLLNYIRLQRITYLKMTPSFWSVIINQDNFPGETFKSLRMVILGGEAINVTDVEKTYSLCSHIQLMNHYGPTEVTIGCIAQFIDRQELESFKARPTIGRPISNIQAYILDRYLNVLPVGITGELCLSGAGVAQGYFKRDALNAEKFILFRPIADKPPIRIYRTGDLARWLPGSIIEFLGRIDQQVKIRGHRIELGEIETRLLRHKEIKEALIVAKEDTLRDDRHLVSYIVGMRKFEVFELREYLSQELPGYMIPSYFIQVESFPMTPNGKIDVKALPGPDEESITSGNYTPPRDEIEKKLIGICSEVLGRNPSPGTVGIDDNFFELGGNSLSLLQFTAKVTKVFKVEIPLVELFKNAKIREISKWILRNELKKSKIGAFFIFNENKPDRIFCFPPSVAYGIVYRYLATYFENTTFCSFNFIETEDRIREYSQLITSFQEKGPYVLSGYSAGGILSFEVARELERQGYEVGALIFLDVAVNKENRTASNREEPLRIAEDFNNNVLKIVEEMGLDFLKEDVQNKLRNYRNYFSNREYMGVVNANIHHIIAENRDEDESANFGTFTTGNFKTYRGHGKHWDMLTPGYVERNAKIIREIFMI